MMTPNGFRWLLWAYLASILATVLVSLAWPGHPHPEAVETEAVTGSAFDHAWAWFFLLPLSIAILASYVGLFSFRRWARALALATTVLSVGLYPLIGVEMMSWPELALSDLSCMLWGAVLATAYFSPVSAHFTADDALRCEPARTQGSA